jgi:hypothetical protein
MKIAIMQPTFLPWLGYFAMINQVDIFVFLDDVQFVKRSWQQRNRISRHGISEWLTLPVISKGLQQQQINETKILNCDKTIKKLIGKLDNNYHSCDHQKKFTSHLETEIFKYQNLADLNCSLIKHYSRGLGINTKFLRSSEIKADGSKSEKLFEICIALGALKYLSAPGSKEYIENEKLYPKYGIAVEYFHYECMTYTDRGAVIPTHLSVIDPLIRFDFLDTQKILAGGSFE